MSNDTQRRRLEDAARTRARRRWSQLVDELAGRYGGDHQWHQWRPEMFADGKTPIPDQFQPVFDAICATLGRAIQIIQWKGPEPFILGYWLSEIEYPEIGVGPTTELTLDLGTDAASLEVGRRMLEMWCNPTATRAEVESAAKELMPSSPTER